MEVILEVSGSNIRGINLSHMEVILGGHGSYFRGQWK